MSYPTFRFEKPLWKKGYLVVGVDEVGRGALAGPLAVGAVSFFWGKDSGSKFLSHESLTTPFAKGGVPPRKRKNFSPSFENQTTSISEIQSLGINDSKKLSAKKREELAGLIKKNCLAWAVAVVSVGFINKQGIVAAFQKGVRDVLKKLKIENCQLKIYLLIDGFYVKYLRGVGLKNQKAIIDGDEKSLSIAAASIIAKVFRDRVMSRLAKKYPRYQWEKNKGYGTREHIEALKKYGKTKYHRHLFLKKIIKEKKIAEN